MVFWRFVFIRISELDILKGIATILMVIYHYFFDLDYLGLQEIEIYSLPWVLFQRVIGFTFLFVTGVTISLNNNKKRRIRHALEIGKFALLITIATFFIAGDGFVKFGILHLIAVSNILIIIFNNPKINFLLGIALIILGLKTTYTDIPYLFWLGPITKDYFAWDHYPLIPWFGAVLLGSSFSPFFKKNGGKIKNRVLEEIGKHSLLIYLIHQPILFILIILASGAPISSVLP